MWVGGRKQNAMCLTLFQHPFSILGTQLSADAIINGYACC